MHSKLTTKQIDVLNRGLALAELWIIEISTLVEEDWGPGTFKRWHKDHRDFSQLIKELSPDWKRLTVKIERPERRTKPMKEQVQSLMAARPRMPKHMPEANQFATVRISQRFFDYLASQKFLDWSGDWPMFIGLSLLVDETKPFEKDTDWELVTR